jgi:hypothetical protein
MLAYRTAGGSASGAEPAPPGVSICRRCGVVAPARGTACDVCARPLAETRLEVAAPSADTFWVAVRCAFTCNSCKFLAPLDGLDADGAVECAHCGLRQRFEVSQWGEALSFAHAVGDLAGPAPEGRHPHPALWIGSENPYAAVGDTKTFEQSESGALTIDAVPGHPVCRTCSAPLTVTVAGPGAATARCPRCGDQSSYTIPDAARNLHPSLVAVVADEHRGDRPRAHASKTQAGVVMLSCPGCGAPLPAAGGERAQTCAFCHAVCFIPTRSLMRVRNEAPAPDVWWILFQGPSTKRRLLEAPTDDGTATVKVGNLLLPRAMVDPIGAEPGVYDAPEVPGIHWPQVGLTVLLGSVAVLIGVVLVEALSP